MNITVSSPEHWENIYEYVKGIVGERTAYVTIEPVKRLKTLKQLGFIFGALITNLQAYYFDCTGDNYTADDLKEMLYQEIGIYKEKQYPNGKTYNSCITLSKMDTEQASRFINDVLNWIDNNTDLVLSPDVRYCWVHGVNSDDLENARRQLPEDCPEYLQYQRQSHCIHCGLYPSVPHHLRSGQYAGMAKKSPDWFSLPLCWACHDKIHESEEQVLANLKHIFCGYSVEDFCRLAFDRWLFKKF